MIFLIEFCIRGRHGAFGSRGPTIYWAFHWASNYSKGFVRRGLLGEVLRLVHLDNTSYALIAFFSFCISLALYAVFMSALFRFARRMPELDQTLLAVILGLSPMTAGILLETSGDPIQLLMLCFLLLFSFVVVPGRNVLLSFAIFTVFGALCALTHEASVFFILPALAVAAFVLQRTPTARGAFFGNLLGGIVLTLFIVFVTQKVPDGSTRADLPTLHYRGQLSTMPPDTFPKFSELLAIEDAANFGHGIRGDAQTALKFAGVLALPFLLVCFTTAFFFGGDRSSPAERRRVFTAFALPVLLSFPLYVIGHDWGRFVAYSFLLSFTILAFWRSEPAPQSPGEQQTALYAGLLVGGFTMLPSPSGFLLTGVLYSRINFIGECILIALIVAQTWSYWSASLSVTSRRRIAITSRI